MASKARYRIRTEAKKHSNLHSQQRRLRHLTCIIGRNIDPNLVPATRHSMKHSLLVLYFTIHSSDDPSNVLYKSESIENTLNPNWREFDPQVFSTKFPQYNNTSSSITVVVWGARKPGDVFRVILRYDVHFSGLLYIHDHLQHNVQSYENNSLLFQMFNGYYGAPTALQKDKVEGKRLEDCIKVSDCQVRLSYKQASLVRAHGVMKAIQQTRQQVNEVQIKMDNLLIEHKACKTKGSERESVMFKIGLLKQELQRLKEKVSGEKKRYDTERDTLRRRADTLQEKRDDLEQYISDMKVNHSTHVKKKEALSSSSTRLAHRRRQLAAELSYIYPIIELPIVKDVKREYAICGVRLPNSEDFVGENDTMLSVGLGNVAHLVFMIAQFLELPLRYPVLVMGSRSTVVDVVTDKLTEKEREFPLYSKGKEKFQFHYGVFLLNKNIAQLRYHNELGTSDLRNTLENLKRLLEDKFGVRIVLKPGNIFGRGRHSESLNNAYNRKETMISRKASLPIKSSNIIQQHAAGIDSVDFVSSSEDNTNTNFRPRSGVLSSPSTSGLPSLSGKGNQHPYILRKGSQRKVVKSTSGTTHSISPDLISVSCDEIVRMAGHGEDEKSEKNNGKMSFGQPQSSEHHHHHQSNKHNDSLIDFGEDCLHDSPQRNDCTSYAREEEDSVSDIFEVSSLNRLNSTGSSELPTLRRTLSDALIIPDPFEREPDDTLSPDSNLNLDNILV